LFRASIAHNGKILLLLFVVFLERDARDRVPFEDLVNHVERRGGAKDRVLEIEPRVVDQVDEELRVARVAAARGQANGTAQI